MQVFLSLAEAGPDNFFHPAEQDKVQLGTPAFNFDFRRQGVLWFWACTWGVYGTLTEHPLSLTQNQCVKVLPLGKDLNWKTVSLLRHFNVGWFVYLPTSNW